MMPWDEGVGANYVRLMLGICSGGVWHLTGEGDVPDSLPISAALVARIEAWQADYDSWDGRHNGDSGDPPECRLDFPFERFDAEGQAIRDSLSRALPGWTVIHQRCWRPENS